MKTAKSIIVVLFVLLTAQMASAYYCPSTGRWLSRDPIGEPGFQALQMASVVRNIAGSPQLAPSHWINRDSLQEKGFYSLFGSSVNKRKINSEIAHDYLGSLYSIRPYVRQKLEPLANKINWDMVKISDNESQQREEANLYEFAIDNPVSGYDVLGLDPVWHPIDVQFCILWWHSFPAGIVLGFTPNVKHCPRKTVQSCCDGANTVFDDSYLPGGGTIPGDSQSYALALALAQVYFQSCLTLGD